MTLERHDSSSNAGALEPGLALSNYTGLAISVTQCTTFDILGDFIHIVFVISKTQEPRKYGTLWFDSFAG